MSIERNRSRKGIAFGYFCRLKSKRVNGVSRIRSVPLPTAAKTIRTFGFRKPCSPSIPWPRRLRAAGESSAAYCALMKALEQKARALVHALQQEHKAELERGPVDTVLQVGDKFMLCTKELLDAADFSRLRPQCQRKGSFRVLVVASPTSYALALPRRTRCSPPTESPTVS